MTSDVDLAVQHVQQLASADAVAALFATLGYDTARLPQTPAALGITADSLGRKIRRIERIADQEAGALQVYLVELDSVTVVATHALARSLRDRAGNYLLVLTDDYEQLDFVLLERELPQGPVPRLSTPRVGVRPRRLTVKRRDPGAVALRVLRRFTYTESDADAQYDKLLSAYAVADWSEPHFNNRALFADYCLNERLPLLPEWAEDPKPVYRQIRELFARVRGQLIGSDEATTRRVWIDPVLAALGFDPSSSPSPPGGRGGEGVRENPACLAYSWSRYLDGKDETRDTGRPDENPGARVVTVLDAGAAPWAIVTNGKLWRLYAARASSRATSFYEIDLEETLAQPDPAEAFRYFWLLFRAAAFRPRPVAVAGERRDLSFVDQIAEESAAYAKRLGDRLKDRVFDEVFPELAKGFIAHIRLDDGTAADLSQERLDQVFRGTLTLLYRVLFLLYAEARDLLPARDVRGYWEKSLSRLKDEIGKAGRPIQDEAPRHLARAYSADPSATQLYERLLDLARIVDRGDAAVNTPVYNGGLFLTEVDPGDDSPEAEAARFLLTYKVPDRFLVLALDRLARDVDEKRGDLVPIDYKSLGVRQIGSIYEGLLEFRLRVAPEKMAIVKGKKTEEVVLYREAVRQKLAILREGRGRDAPERTIARGAVYLENDRRERKATGSYYTPDHIVEYIVEHAVGPVLQEHLDRLRPKLREAQQAYQAARQRQAAFQKQGLAGDDPEKVANNPRWQAVADELFEFRVLDPAMGSGHFLVEAVDFITDRMLDFLNGFPWNPVQAQIHQTRESIQAETERQGVTVDSRKLTDVNLLRRHVLKRCMYGVDLNPMAVELAKVSLWLHCFTLGAPLSFLDHHLKCGNSLIGTTVDAVEAELAAQKQGHHADLFGGPFQGLLSATAMIEELGRIPDATVDQARRSRELFTGFEEAQAPYKAALDIWVSRHFGNRRAQEYLTLVGQDYVEEIRTGGAGLSPEYRQVIAIAGDLSRQKRFFHWDLEFPEAFVDLEHKTWKAKDQQGFDAVIGNPPYDELSQYYSNTAETDVAFFSDSAPYRGFKNGRVNLYRLFIVRGLEEARLAGRLAYITPMSLLADDFSRPTREFLLHKHAMASVEALPQKDDPYRRVFPEAKLSTCIFVVAKGTEPRQFLVRTHPGRFIEPDSPAYSAAPKELTQVFKQHAVVPTVSDAEWSLLKRVFARPAWPTLGVVAHVYVGEVFDNAPNKQYLSDDPVGPLVLRGANVDRYLLRDKPRQGQNRYLRETLFLKDKSRASKLDFVATERVGLQRGAAIDNWRRLIACLIPGGAYSFDTVLLLVPRHIDKRVLLGLLNSDLWEWRFHCTSTTNHVNEYELTDIIVPPCLLDQRSDEHNQLLALVQSALETAGTGVRRSDRQIAPPDSVDSQIDQLIFQAYSLTEADTKVIRAALER